MKKIILILILSGSISVCFGQRFYEDAPPKNKFRISASGGIGYRIAKAPPGYESSEYMKQIRLGSEFQADAAYFLPNGTGIGMKYFLFSNAGSGNLNGIDVISNIHISYIGPIMQQSIRLHSLRSKIMYGISLGYMGYKDDGWMD